MTTELTDQALRDLLEDLGPEQPEEGGPWMTTVKTQRALCEGLLWARHRLEVDTLIFKGLAIKEDDHD